MWFARGLVLSFPLGDSSPSGYTVSPVGWDTYFLANGVENQKLNQTTAELPFG